MARNTYFEDEVIRQKWNPQQIKKVGAYVAKYKKELFGGLILMGIASVCSLGGPYISKIVMDDLIPSGNIPGIFLAVGVFLLLVCAQAGLTIAKGFLMNKLGYWVIYDLRKDLFAHIQTLSFQFFDDRPTGKILVRLTNYINALASLLSDGIVNLVTDFVTLIAIIVIMLTIDVRLTAVSLITCIPLALVVFGFKNAIHYWQVQTNYKNSNRTAYVHENIMGVKIIQSFTREKQNAQVYDGLNQTCVDTWIHAFRLNQIFLPCIDIIGVLGTVATYYVGWLLLGENLMTVGIIFAFSGYITRFWQPINNMSVIYNQMLTAMANLETIFDILETEPDLKDAPNAEELPPIKGEVTFDHVTFGYEEGQTVLQDVSFQVKSGQTIALVGPTGAGKTTVVNLISRFYDLRSGRVLIDGHDVSQVTLHSLRSQMGIMMQDSFVFEGTILDNIRYGRLDATEEECIEAAKAIYADEFIQKMPQGYQTHISERGSELSAGERQLLSFARVVLANPKILILDEATSTIDTETERVIQRALERLLQGRTSFIIAHRLSTIKQADCIMCIAEGGVKEAGTHHQLLEKRGMYYQLLRAQYEALER